ncbi:hypothetical protein [Cupriavidus nantongensis]|uniref:hypothetical protein n=1 Tax=Cupriavidus nantongensis TaxID=1796606 RepID=UPI00358DF08E
MDTLLVRDAATGFYREVYAHNGHPVPGSRSYKFVGAPPDRDALGDVHVSTGGSASIQFDLSKKDERDGTYTTAYADLVASNMEQVSVLDNGRFTDAGKDFEFRD